MLIVFNGLMRVSMKNSSSKNDEGSTVAVCTNDVNMQPTDADLTN